MKNEEGKWMIKKGSPKLIYNVSNNNQHKSYPSFLYNKIIQLSVLRTSTFVVINNQKGTLTVNTFDFTTIKAKGFIFNTHTHTQLK